MNATHSERPQGGCAKHPSHHHCLLECTGKKLAQSGQADHTGTLRCRHVCQQQLNLHHSRCLPGVSLGSPFPFFLVLSCLFPYDSLAFTAHSQCYHQEGCITGELSETVWKMCFLTTLLPAGRVGILDGRCLPVGSPCHVCQLSAAEGLQLEALVICSPGTAQRMVCLGAPAPPTVPLAQA